MNAQYRESVVTFGERNGLIGILTTPMSSAPNIDAPHVIFINSGIIHRVGANRVYVTFARTLAAAGIPSLRFDLSGIGDSERRGSSETLQEVVHSDIGAAIDHLANTKRASRFALIGLCSGAFDAFDHARRDPRVVAAAMLDMPGPFRNWSHSAVFIGVRLLRPITWRRRIRSFARKNSLLALTRKPESTGFLPGVRGGRSHADMRVQLKELLARGTKLAFVFTAGLENEYNHRLQFHIRFPRAAAHPSLRVEFVATSDHTLSSKASRTHVSGWLQQWLVKDVATVGSAVITTPATESAKLTVASGTTVG